MKLFIQFSIVLFLFLLCAASEAQYEPTKKEFSLAGCEKKVESIKNKAQRKKALSLCQCEIEATDYNSINDSLQKGALDLQKIISDSKKIKKECESRHQK